MDLILYPQLFRLFLLAIFRYFSFLSVHNLFLLSKIYRKKKKLFCISKNIINIATLGIRQLASPALRWKFPLHPPKHYRHETYNKSECFNAHPQRENCIIRSRSEREHKIFPNKKNGRKSSRPPAAMEELLFPKTTNPNLNKWKKTRNIRHTS